MSRKYKMDDSEQLNKSPRKKAKVCLKTLEIKIDQEVEEELDETVWMDLDEFYSNEGSFHTAKSQHDTEKPQDLSHMALLASETQANELDPMTGNDSTLGQNDDNRSESDFRQVKRLIWGEEVPCNTTAVPLDSDQANSLLSVGANPLITIRPAGRTEKNKDDIVITSGSLTTSLVVNASNRVLNIDQLRNYFLLTQGEATSGTETSQYKANQQQYFLSLLDPSMPRMTNCGYYFRMRYAVYVLLSQVTRSMCQFSSTSNWRQRAQERLVQERGRDTRKGPLLHIGEMHLYTIFPKDGKLVHSNLSSEQLPWWCKGGKTNFIHYENISFFVNQTPLTMEEQASLRVTENDINQMVLSFRRFLKHINSTVVSAKMANFHSGDQVTYNSTYLLEQLKYPKSSDDFSNPDRICEQFVRNQVEMFARYAAHFAGKKLEDDALASSGVSTQAKSMALAGKESKDLLTGDSFVASLFNLNNQAEPKSMEA